MPDPVISDEDARTLLAAAAAIEDTENQLWSAELAKRATVLWMKNCGRILSVSEVASQVGKDRSTVILAAIIEERKFRNQLVGYRSPCHFCESPIELVGFDFALMRTHTSSIAWKDSAASIVIGAGTLALLGGAAFRLPGKSYSGEALALRLIICKSCRKEEANFWGLFSLNEKRASRHPLWNFLYEAGFTKFLSAEAMPVELTIANSIRL